MGNLFRNLYVQFREFYKQLSPVKRVSAVASVLIFLAGLVPIALMSSTKDYITLLSNIPPENVPQIAQKLQEKSIPFKVGPDGTSILIPKELLHTTQMTIMSEMGSNKLGNIGFEIFEKQDFGATSYSQRVNFQRALQGELMRAVNTLDAVKQSKVILALPPKKTFLEEGGQVSASVVVELHPGKSLSPEQVKGITFLVSSAVEGLEPERVTVVDSRGKVMSKGTESASSASSDLLEMKTKVEQELEAKLEGILSRVAGNGRVIARVNASLNHRNIATVEEVVDPEKTAIKAVQSEEESLDGSRTNPTGVPGARANLPGAQETGQTGFNQNVKKELKTTNYEVPKTVRNIKESPGTLERISVAILVDGVITVEKGENGESIEKWSPRSDKELSQYEALVKNAIGFDEKRGDSVKIENIKFEREDFSDSERLLSAMERKKLFRDLLKWTVLALSLGLFFFLVVRPFMRWITDSFQDSVEDMLPRTIEELEELQSVDNTLPGMSGALPILEDALDPDKAESELLKERIMGLVGGDEEKAAGAFSLWLVRKDG